MDRETIAAILDGADGVSRGKDGYKVAEDHRLTFYLGQPGQAMVVADLAMCRLGDAFVTLEKREDGTRLFVDYGAVHALAIRPPGDDKKDRRAGFA